MKTNKQQNNQDPKIAVLDQQVSEINEKYLRALADYQNLQKQTENWKEEFVQYSNTSLVNKLLEVYDDLEKAESHLKNEGLTLIVNKVKNILREQNVEELSLLGTEFDPTKSEVISTQPGDKQNIILDIVQKGYKMKDRIIRPAKVIVATVIPNEDEGSNIK